MKVVLKRTSIQNPREPGIIIFLSQQPNALNTIQIYADLITAQQVIVMDKRSKSPE
ncbi:hypothetical protein OM945_00335 [Levilactobacillus namurensis]|uniref:hypothetical protein n=1 Tax=Levilactobacillus namurensis TaxID=380393 RepID=UPI0028B72C80|nr:hypothetical protein [Levilactobacillus namurensis]MCW3777322.1 hypothetical protein [Levilactobacillus namurensis]MDT7018612.1 hypothetical protein [Levilactobacillus namurensis]